MSRKALTYDFTSQLGRDVASDDLVVLMQEEGRVCRAEANS